MIVTISELLKTHEIPLENTVYEKDSQAVRDFKISAGDFFEVCADKNAFKIYDGMFNVPESTPAEKSFLGGDLNEAAGMLFSREACQKRLEEIGRRLKALKNAEEDLTHAHAGEIKQLRQEKKQLSALLDTEAFARTERSLLKFKNCLFGTSFDTIRRYIPQFFDVSFRGVHEIPFFTKHLGTLKNAIETGRPVAISGGPCLFGVNEVLVEVHLKDGTVMDYDFSSGRHFAMNNDGRDMAEDLEEMSAQVAFISFINQKRGVTTQEYDSIHCLFECAHALGAKLTIPLPDMSYIKFFKNIAAPLPSAVAEDAIDSFRREAFVISDMYLAVIDRLKEQYPTVEVAVIHERDRAMCRMFYEGREPLLTPTMLRRLTAVRGKTDAVLDYITMPALPYYIWGIKDIIQMDSLDETDSYRKCCKLHKGLLNICAMMYPERISGDAQNTIFYAPLAYKEYMTPLEVIG